MDLTARFTYKGDDPSTGKRGTVDKIQVFADRGLKSRKLDVYDLDQDEAIRLATQLLNAVDAQKTVRRR